MLSPTKKWRFFSLTFSTFSNFVETNLEMVVLLVHESCDPSLLQGMLSGLDRGFFLARRSWTNLSPLESATSLDLRGGNLDNLSAVRSRRVSAEVVHLSQSGGASVEASSSAAFVVHGDVEGGRFLGSVSAPEVSFESKREVHCGATCDVQR